MATQFEIAVGQIRYSADNVVSGWELRFVRGLMDAILDGRKELKRDRKRSGVGKLRIFGRTYAGGSGRVLQDERPEGTSDGQAIRTQG